MIKIRQILRLSIQGRNKAQIAAQIGLSRNTLKKYLKEFAASKLSLEELDALSDKELDEQFVKPEDQSANARLIQLFELFPAIDKELRKKGVTQELQWEAYKKRYPDGLGKSQFKNYYVQWKAQVNPTMHLEHKAGDKLYVDFAGDKLHIADIQTGELLPVEVFVAILGASQLTYVEAVFTQQKADFIGACANALEFYNGVPQAIVPDNLRAAVTKSSKYEPEVNAQFADFAEHYGTVILPARAYRPRDKALVENAVRIMYTRIYVPVRRAVYNNLEDLNAAILLALTDHNNTLLRGRNYSRRQQFEEIERAALMPLPPTPYEIKEQSQAKVAKNGHVALGKDKHYYSVPHRLIGKKVQVLYSRSLVEIFYKHEKVAAHQRVKSPHHYTTNPDHLASTHRFVSDWNPEKFLSWAASIDEDVMIYISKVLEQKQHPEQAYKACVGILSFVKKVGAARLIKACKRGLAYGVYNYGIIERILEKELDKHDVPDKAEQLPMPLHDNIRGENYYK